jgi:hypothetical protein
MRGLLLGGLLLAACHGTVDEDGDGYAAVEDCDDGNADVNPSVAETCNGIDDDCDTKIDDRDDDVVGATAYFADADADGFGDVALGSYCAAPDGAVVQDGDCDDTNAAIGPEAEEICNEVDDDCDQKIDLEDDSVQADAMWYRDGDGDGYGSSADFVVGCEVSDGYVAQAGDCDDGDAGRNPGAPEICDGKDNNCDVASGLLVDDADPAYVGHTGEQYLDDDGDGVGGDVVVEECDPELFGHLVGVTGDCADDDATRFPGQVELCDDVDSDCDGTSGDDEWSLDTEVFRVAIDVTGASDALLAPPVAIDVDLNEPLDDGEVVSPSTMLFVAADCAAGFPKVPFDFADRVRNFFGDGAPVSDVVYQGTVGFRYDRDGVWSTQETLPAGETKRFYLYWSSTTRGSAGGFGPSAPAMTYGAATSPSVDNGITKLELDTTKGGLASFLGLSTGDDVGDQTSLGAGNGIYFGVSGGTGAWTSSIDAGSSSTTNLLSQGDVMAVWQSASTSAIGDAHGLYKYGYTYLVFNGRPEVYVKTTFELVQASYIGDQAGGWASAVRPFEADLAALGTGVGVADPGRTWMRSAFAGDTKGVFVGWRTLPDLLATPVYTAASGRFVGLAGADYTDGTAADGANGRWVPNGTRVVDGRVVMVVPYVGAWSSVEDQMLGLQEGTSAVVGTAEAR